MLHLWLGRSGSGKSTGIRQTLEQLSPEELSRVFLLVPEQSSFMSERNLLETLGTAKTARLHFLDFSRLADRVFREVGGIAGERLDDGTRALLMSRACEEARNLAQVLGQTPSLGGKQATDSGTVTRLLSLYNEMKQCAVPPEELERVEREISDTEQSSLAQKTGELRRIFTAYEGLTADCGQDTADILTRLAEKMEDSHLLDGATVYIDGFKGFTAQQLAVLERILARAKDITVTLSTDTPGKVNDPQAEHRREIPLFSPVTRTVSQLRELAARHNCPVEIQLFSENRRSISPALRTLEAGLYAPVPTADETVTTDVTVTVCTDIYEECEAVARSVRRLVREEGWRCRDITVVCRRLGEYRSVLQSAMEQAGIPLSVDARRDILCEPLVCYIRSAVRLAVGGWDTEILLRLLKTDLTPLSPVEIAQLENYLFQWRIDGAAWDSPFTENPAGLDAPVTPMTARRLAQLNDWRQQVTAPLCRMREALKKPLTGRDFSAVVYDFLTADPALTERITDSAERLEEIGEIAAVQRTERLLESVTGVLDCFADGMGEQPYAAERLEELFGMLLQMIDLGQLPQGLDAVTVGQADRIRYDSPRAVFILGANDGVFPAYPKPDGIISEADRKIWQEHGISLSGDLLEQCMEERYYAYMAVAAPSERLFVSYTTADGAAPSPLIQMIKKLLPNHTVLSGSDRSTERLETETDMLRRIASEHGQFTPAGETVYRVLEEDSRRADHLAAMRRQGEKAPFRLQDPAVAKDLFGGDIVLSASRVEKYENCRFSYFCRYGLGVVPRKRADVDAALFGTLVHYVMETLVPVYSRPDGLADELRVKTKEPGSEAGQETENEPETETKTEPENDPKPDRSENRLQEDLLSRIRQDTAGVIDRYVNEHFGGTQNKSGRFCYQLELARKAAENMLWHTVMEFRQSRFRPAAFELAILPDGNDGDGVVSFRLPFSDGTVRLNGKIDRVDLYIRPSGDAFVRVVDYKTGTKVFDLGEVYQGLNTQMLLYLFVLCDNGRQYLESEGELHPAGVLYHPLSSLTVQRGKADTDAARLKNMKMSGVVLNNAEVIRAMEQDAQKIFIPAGIKKEGGPDGSVLTEEQFKLIRQRVEQLLISMADTLASGDVAAIPLQSNEHDACRYCDYHAICRREDGDRNRPLEKIQSADVLEKIAGEEDRHERTGVDE